MRRLLTGLAVAALTTVASALALAGDQDQQVAKQIEANMQNSGRLADYKVGVNYRNGTAWLSGKVRSEEQMVTALRIALETPGVEKVVNNLSTGDAGMKSLPAPQRTPAVQRVATTAPSSAIQRTSAVEPQYAPMQEQAPRRINATAQRPMPIAYRQPEGPMPNGMAGAPMPMYTQGMGGGPAPARYDQPCMPNYAWPSYASYPNYAAVTYPKQYSPTAWPYIGPFYPYPQVPLGWRKVTLEWDDGWWFLDFKDKPSCWKSPMGRWY